MVRIGQILANFLGKIQIWAQFDKNFEKKNSMKSCQKRRSFGERLSKICCELSKQVVLEPRVSPEHTSKYVDTVTVFVNA